MNFDLTEEQKQIKALVREFCEREVDQKRMAEILRKNDVVKTIEEMRRNYPHDIVEKAYKAGLQTIGIPTRYGGPGPDTDRWVTLAVALEEAGYSGGILGVEFQSIIIGPQFYTLTALTNPYLTEQEREETFSQALKYNPQPIAGCVTEPAGATDIHLGYDEGGSNILQVIARKDGNEWVINGDKMFSSSAAIADNAFVLARTKDGPISESASIFTGIPINTPGVSRTLNKFLYTGFGGNCQFNFDNVRAPESALLGQLHTGWKQTVFMFQWKWAAHSYLGLLQKMYEHMRDYAKQRVGGGKPLIQHTSVAEKLGDLALRLEATRALWYKAAWEGDQIEKSGAPCPPRSNWYTDAVFTVSLKQAAWRFFELAHEIYGSIVLSDDLPLQNFFRYIYNMRAGTLPANVGLMKICWDYDTRYYYETYEDKKAAGPPTVSTAA